MLFVLEAGRERDVEERAMPCLPWVLRVWKNVLEKIGDNLDIIDILIKEKSIFLLILSSYKKLWSSSIIIIYNIQTLP